MSGRLRTIALLSLLVVLAGWACFPLFSAGFLGEDLRVLLKASDLAWPATAQAGSARPADLLWNGEAGPLGNLSLALTSRLASTHGAWDGSEAVFVRLENFLLLLAAAGCLGLVARRALAPWTGPASAGAAGYALALLVACHPLSVPVVASAARRGDLLATILCAAAAVLFLRARQDRAHVSMTLALACAVLAGLASPIALLLPPALALLELVSARRHRPALVRARTGATTLVAFGACVGVEIVLALIVRQHPRLADAAREIAAAFGGGRLAGALTLAVEKLGLVLLPITRAGGAQAPILAGFAGALLLLALQPALAAARAAPRMWGTLALVGCTAVLLALLAHPLARVEPGDLSRAALLFPAAIVVCAGLAASATALSGSRRTWVPLVVGAGYAWIAQGSAQAWPEAASVLGDLRADLWAARQIGGPGARDARVLVVDPPGRERGLDVLSGSLPLLVDPRLEGIAVEAGARGSGGAAQGLAYPALLAFLFEPEFARLRAEKLVILLPATASSARAPFFVPAPDVASSGTEVAHPTLFWREEGRSPILDVDPLAHRAIRVTARTTASTARPPRMTWRSDSPEPARPGDAPGTTGTPGSVNGVWIAGADGPVAIFDLSRSPAWLFGRRVRRVWFEDDLAQIVSAEVLEHAPALPVDGVLSERGDAWLFDVPQSARPRPLHAEGVWTLGLLDVQSFRYLELEARPGAAGELAFPGATAFARPASGDADAPVAWSLELRVGAVAVSRVAGRR